MQNVCDKVQFKKKIPMLSKALCLGVLEPKTCLDAPRKTQALHHRLGKHLTPTGICQKKWKKHQSSRRITATWKFSAIYSCKVIASD